MKKRAVSLLLTLALLCSLLAVPASAAGYTKCYLGSGYGTTYNIDFILSHGQHPAVEFFDADEADITNGKSSCFYSVANGCRISIDVREGTQSSSSVTVIPCTSTFTDDSTVIIQQHDESWTLSDGDILDERTFGGYNTLCCIGSYRDYRYAFYFYLAPNSSDVTTPDAGDQGTGSKPEQPEQPEQPTKPEAHIHVWETTTIPSTCTQPGKKIRTCTRCGAEETEPLLTLAAHRWRSDYTPITCEKDGVMTRTCTVCGREEITKTYPTTGHQYTEQIIRPATAEQEGLKKLTCTRCGDVRQEAIPKLPQSPAASQTGNRHSGSTAMKKLSQSEIARLLTDNPLDLPDNVLDSMPSCTAPFAAGSVKTEALQAAANRLNALRRIAGLPDVTLDLSLCEEAQYGAVIQGHYGALDHYPSKPAGMSDAFYQRAYAASSSSNLYAGRTLTTAVDGWMNDSDQTNVDRLGHRRWQLNPALGKVGFGYAEANTRYHTYLAEKVLDKSGSGCEYDFISWPASGNFPAELFGKNIAWSISLNPMEYQTPRQSDLTVTLTREADGKVWTFRGSSYAPTDSGNYFRVDTGGYGIPNCIIFRPDGIQTYDGIYTVQIQGLKTRNGQSVKDFAYQVEFFGSDPQDRPSVPVQPEKPTQPEKPSQGTGFRDVPAGAYYADAVTWAVKEGITSGTSANTFSPNLSCTRAQMVTFLWRANGSPRASRANRFTDVSANAYYYDAVLWAAENGITSGSSATTFSPDAVLTRGQTVTFLYRAAGSPAVSGSSFRDVAPGAWYANAVAWAVSKGVTTGTGGNHFSPDAPCTRAQTVTFLYRDAQ